MVRVTRTGCYVALATQQDGRHWVAAERSEDLAIHAAVTQCGSQASGCMAQIINSFTKDKTGCVTVTEDQKTQQYFVSVYGDRDSSTQRALKYCNGDRPDACNMLYNSCAAVGTSASGLDLHASPSNLSRNPTQPVQSPVPTNSQRTYIALATQPDGRHMVASARDEASAIRSATAKCNTPSKTCVADVIASFTDDQNSCFKVTEENNTHRYFTSVYTRGASTQRALKYCEGDQPGTCKLIYNSCN